MIGRSNVRRRPGQCMAVASISAAVLGLAGVCVGTLVLGMWQSGRHDASSKLFMVFTAKPPDPEPPPTRFGDRWKPGAMVKRDTTPPPPIPTFYTHPTVWPKEADAAARAYKGPPDFEKLLFEPRLTPQEITINVSQYVLWPKGRLRVTTGSEIHDMESEYTQDFKRMMNALPKAYHNQTIVIWFGDFYGSMPYPMLTKARLIGDQNGIMLPLRHDRHFVYDLDKVKRDPYTFRRKSVKAFWRGSDTGGSWNDAQYVPQNLRRGLVERWGLFPDKRIDVGLNEIRQHFPHYWSKYLKNKVVLRAQLRYKYLISVEGNDVATGLKWMMASNSVVLMPPPRREVWYLEGQLKPWVHYVPVRQDFSDVWDRVLLCEAHQDKCEAIAKRANEYVVWFRNSTRNYELGTRRLQEYLDNIKFNVVT